MDGTAPTIALPMERPLYTPTVKMAWTAPGVSAVSGEFDATALFEQFFVDPARLSQVVRRSLQRQPQVGLVRSSRPQPLEQGLAELVTYLSLSDDLFQVIFDERATEQVSWADQDGTTRVATIPRVTFTTAPSRSETDHDQAVARPIRADLPLAVTSLMKGVVYRDTHEKAWRHLIPLQSQVRDYVATMGLAVVVDEAEGYAFLRSRPDDGDGDDARHSAADSPPLAVAPCQPAARAAAQKARRIRRAGQRHPARADRDPDRRHGPGIPAPRDQRGQAGRPDRRAARQGRRAGFPAAAQGRRCYEVRRVLKAFVDAQWLAGLDEQLARYAAELSGDGIPATRSRMSAMSRRDGSLGEPRPRAGFRLQPLEVFNWGTFDHRVWTLQLDGSNGCSPATSDRVNRLWWTRITTLLVPSEQDLVQQGRRRRDHGNAACAPMCWAITNRRATKRRGTSRPVALRSEQHLFGSARRVR